MQQCSYVIFNLGSRCRETNDNTRELLLNELQLRIFSLGSCAAEIQC